MNLQRNSLRNATNRDSGAAWASISSTALRSPSDTQLRFMEGLCLQKQLSREHKVWLWLFFLLVLLIIAWFIKVGSIPMHLRDCDPGSTSCVNK